MYLSISTADVQSTVAVKKLMFMVDKKNVEHWNRKTFLIIIKSLINFNKLSFHFMISLNSKMFQLLANLICFFGFFGILLAFKRNEAPVHKGKLHTMQSHKRYFYSWQPARIPSFPIDAPMSFELSRSLLELCQFHSRRLSARFILNYFESIFQTLNSQSHDQLYRFDISYH